MRKRLLKKFMAGILSSAMVFGMTHFTQTTVQGADNDGIWIAGVQITERNMDDVLTGKNKGKVSYDPDTNTLTLNGADIEYNSSARSGQIRVLEICGLDVTINLIGENKITVTSKKGTCSDCYGILRSNPTGEGGLTIKGTGSLEIVNKMKSSGNLYGIYCNGTLTFENCTVTVDATGTCTNTKTGYRNTAVGADAVCITGGKLTAKSGTCSSAQKEVESSYAIDAGQSLIVDNAVIDAQAGEGHSSVAVYAEEISVNHSEITAAGGTGVDVSTTKRDPITLEMVTTVYDGESYGIAGSSLTVNESKLSVQGGEAGYSFGIWAAGMESKGNSTVLAAGGTDGRVATSVAIYCPDLNIADGTISARGGAATAESYGISASRYVQNGGTVSAIAGQGTDYSIGLWTENISVSSGRLTAAAKADGSQTATAVTKAPVFDGYNVTVKAGQNEENAQAVETPTEDTYTNNAYVAIGPYICVHEWSDEWSFDETHHWHNCKKTDCTLTENADKDGYAEHTPQEDDGDETTAVLCSVCKTVMVPAQGHEFSTEFFHDENGHWHECIHDGCTEKTVKQNHTFIEGVPDPAPTYQADGKRIDVCACGETKTVILPKLSNSGAPQLSVADGAVYCAAVTVTVTDDNLETVTVNGEPVTLTNGQFTVLPSDNVWTIEAADKAGEKTTASITVNTDHIWDEGKIDVPATQAVEGVKIYTCKNCGTQKTEPVAKLAPTINEGNGVMYTQGEDKSLIFRSEALLEDFISVSVDGTVLEAKDYTAVSGSTIVTLNAEYLNTLSEGEHILEMKFVTGSALAAFKIETEEDAGGTNITDTQTLPGVSSVKTKDASNTACWLIILLFSGSALAGTYFSGRKKVF